MNCFKQLLLLFLFIAFHSFVYAESQPDSLSTQKDSANILILENYRQQIAEFELHRRTDSASRAALEKQLASLKTTDNFKKEEIQKQLDALHRKDEERVSLKRAQIDSLRDAATGFPVIGILPDTLFLLYTRIGSYTAHERANNISARIKALYDDDFMNPDSLYVVSGDAFQDIMYKDRVIMSVSETDAIWNNVTPVELANTYRDTIRNALVKAREENSLLKFITRLALVLLALVVVTLLIWSVNKLYVRWLIFVEKRKGKWLRDLSYKDYTFLSAEQEFRFLLFFFKGVRWFTIALLLYLVIPIIFSIFPFTRGWADDLFGLVWRPFRGLLLAVWDYLPNVFTILVIYFVMKYVIRFVKYIFSEIESGKLKISGFHEDWAKPTYSIVRFLLYAFMFVIMFRYLPYADSDVFKGVSVFIGVLFSLGSTSAIANIVAGLVITYMRPFKIGDRIRIGDISGDVIEKTLLVTRLRTVKNEEITIPNSSVLSVNTINYSSFCKSEGLIVHTTVTIGYDVPWQDMYAALIDAALRSELVLRNPKPFVLQTSLDDFYVSYQINAYTHEANRQALVYSQLHQHIQDVCNERGIEIMSPHYRAQRDGNQSTIPANYLPEDYQAPGIKVEINEKKSQDC